MKGMSVLLLEKTRTGTDAFNQPVFSENWVEVNDVLVAQPSTDDITDTLTLNGKRLAYKLGIPKGDGHTWENTKVKFFGRTFLTIGAPIQGIEANIPGRWHKIVKVEFYE